MRYNEAYCFYVDWELLKQMALPSARVQEGKAVQRVIIVPQKLVNIVATPAG
ncbi:MAG: hypothetical protein ONB44_05270 [candidate division KSB1 bacterium]|nr:hypothetical protein [candidate division KSB1 bacterium]MDZ7301534.1 hypothetical protein [candidate division KSB1 bacterium]MDZ7311050.1 hypothetical protein [candidate division KSB1 bacterium]